MSKQREQFERWAGAPPREWCLLRNHDDPRMAWPGQYRDYHVQCAWEAWQEMAQQCRQTRRERRAELAMHGLLSGTGMSTSPKHAAAESLRHADALTDALGDR